MTYDDHVECDKSYQKVCEERDAARDLLREFVKLKDRSVTLKDVWELVNSAEELLGDK